jgi:hypothetical protein
MGLTHRSIIPVPLLDHFHPPLYPHHSWESFHSNWATRIADAIGELLPPEFLVEEHTHAGRLEIDIATFERSGAATGAPPNGPTTTTLPARTQTLPAAALTMPVVFPETFQVRVLSTTGGLTLVAVVELVSPGHKDRAEERRAFATKCASYLHQGVSLIVMDIVTIQRANLHNETMRLMQAAGRFLMPEDEGQYAAAYRPVLREQRPEIDLWPAAFAVGEALPTLPLRLTGDLFIMVDFETTYQEACRHRRLFPG